MAKNPNFRTDSTLGNLPRERQEEIAQFLEAVEKGDRHEQTRLHLAEDGIKVSRTAVSNWYSGWQLRQSVEHADSLTAQFEELLRASNCGMSAQQIESAGQFMFTSLAVKSGDAREFQNMEYLRLAKETARTKARQKDADLALANRRVTLLEENQRSAKEKLSAVVSKGGLTPETLREIEEAAKLL